MTYRIDRDRVRGMVLGAAVGDALGWPQEERGGLIGGRRAREAREPTPEFRAWMRTSGRYKDKYRDRVRPGEYSDDTQLLCAVARACLTGDDWWTRLVRVELPAWHIYQRGGGGAVLAAAAAWADGRPPWESRTAKARATRERYHRAGANGVAMRIAPHVVVGQGSDITSRVLRDGLATHGHPRALAGAVLYSSALSTALRSNGTLEYGALLHAALDELPSPSAAIRYLPEGWGEAADIDRFGDEWTQALKEVDELLDTIESSLAHGALSRPDATLERLGCSGSPINGAGTVTAAGALYLTSRFAARPMAGLLTAAFLRQADTDTLGSMTASLLGAIHGTEWLGHLGREVQDADYLDWLADRLYEGANLRLPTPHARPTTLRKRLYDALDHVVDDRPSHGEFVDGRNYQIVDTELIDEGKVIRYTLRLEDGQSVRIDRPGPSRAVSAARQVAVQGDRAMTSPLDSQAADGVISVTLETHQLSRCASFYARLLGTDVAVLDGVARVTPWLELRQGSSEDARQDVVIRVKVRDIRATLRRLDVASSVQHSGELRVLDPDGRQVHVTQ